jgi:cytochrome c-type biogenesis protein CcmF
LLAAFLGLRDPAGLAGIFIAVWLAVACIQDLLVRIGFRKVPFATSLHRMIGLPRSAWGLYVGHFGLAIAAAGVIAVSVWKVEAIQTVELGKPTQVGQYEFTLTRIQDGKGPNFETSIAVVEVTRDGAPVATLLPERRWYPVERKPSTEAGIITLWHGDLYAVLGDPSDTGGFVTRYYYNAGVPWMWIGAVLITLSALISLTDRRLRIGAPSARKTPARAAAPAE